jgi:uncharacterized protein (TIGR02611 family)
VRQEQDEADERGQPDAVLGPAAGPPGYRDRIRRHRSLDAAYRLSIGVVGTVVVLTGLVLVPAPGPGWLIVFAGLSVLAAEFRWARRLRDYGKDKIWGWTRWITEQSAAVRAAVSLLGLALLAGLVAGYLWWQGVPGWVPSIG